MLVRMAGVGEGAVESEGGGCGAPRQTARPMAVHTLTPHAPPTITPTVVISRCGVARAVDDSEGAAVTGVRDDPGGAADAAAATGGAAANGGRAAAARSLRLLARLRAPLDVPWSGPMVAAMPRTTVAGE